MEQKTDDNIRSKGRVVKDRFVANMICFALIITQSTRSEISYRWPFRSASKKYFTSFPSLLDVLLGHDVWLCCVNDWASFLKSQRRLTSFFKLFWKKKDAEKKIRLDNLYQSILCLTVTSVSKSNARKRLAKVCFLQEPLPAVIRPLWAVINWNSSLPILSNWIPCYRPAITWELQQTFTCLSFSI